MIQFVLGRDKTLRVRVNTALIIAHRIPQAVRMKNMRSQFMESNAFVKSTKTVHNFLSLAATYEHRGASTGTG